MQTDLSWWDILRLAWFVAGLKLSQVYGRVFNYDLPTPYVTEGGADVLLISDRQKVNAWVDGIFEAPPPGTTPDGSAAVPGRGADILRRRNE